MPQLRIKIVGERLPGRRCGDHHDLHIGIQRGDVVENLVPADAPSATFDVMVMRRDDGDFRSPYVHGKPGDRFLYLSWHDGDSSDATRVGRVKLMLADIPTGLLRADTQTLEAYLTLTDDRGRPVTAAVRPPKVTWASS